MFDAEKNFVESNQAGLDLLGYSRDELLSMSIPDVDADPVAVLPAHDQLLSGNHLIAYEHGLRRKNGEIITVLNNSRPLTDATGNVIGMQSTLIDITARKQAELALRASERDYRLLFERNLAGVYRTKPDGTILNCNDAMARMFGYASREELISVRAQDLYLDALDREDSIDRLCRVGVLTNSECRMQRKDGSPIDVLETVQVVPDEDGESWTIFGTMIDVTDSKRAEMALRDSEERYRSVFEQAAESIVVIDAETGELIEFNDRAHEVLGYTRAEFRELGIADIDMIDSADDVARRLERIVETGAESFETRQRTKTGDVRSVLVSGRVLRIPGRKLISAIVADLTEYKRKEQELEEAHRQLLQASRRAGMSEVATDVLHNVGNVLNSINVSAGLVSEKIRGFRVPSLTRATMLMSEHAHDLGNFITQDERGRQLPGYLTRLADHLTDEQADVLGELRSLTQNIEHVKNIISMQQSLAGMAGVIEPVRISDLLDDLLKMDADSRDRRGVQVVCEYDELPAIVVDKHKLTQILVNLLKNAKDALAECSGSDKRLTLRLKTPDTRHIRIEVADNAKGIPPEHLTKIFAHGFTTKKDGHGFGLHGSALAATELGGSLTAHSDGPGRGATFALELPLRAAEKNDVWRDKL